MFSFFLLMILVLFPIILLATIILLVTKKSKESFESKIRTIYCYIIILACIISIIVCLINIINTIVDILIPNKNIESLNTYYRTLVLCISAVVILIPVGIYHKKKIQKLG